jgi:hypothetical protein
MRLKKFSRSGTLFANLQNWFEKRKSQNHLRQISFSFDGRIITADGPFARRTSVRIEDIREIGIETTDAGPFVEDVFWLINRNTEGLRIPQDSTVFNRLVDYFESFEGFDWEPFTKAMASTDNRYFLCWKRRNERS